MKITINGEQFSYDFDFSHMPMSEALAIEKALNRRYVEWEQAVFEGSAEAVAAFAWLIWTRDGRDVKLEDILSGEVGIDFTEMFGSILRGVTQDRIDAAQAAANPTSGAAPRTEADGTATTPSGTRASSRKS